MIDPLTWQT